MMGTVDMFFGAVVYVRVVFLFGGMPFFGYGKTLYFFGF